MSAKNPKTKKLSTNRDLRDYRQREKLFTLLDAAPDMLKALRTIAALIEYDGKIGPSGIQTSPIKHIEFIAMNAIAKAEGRTK